MTATDGSICSLGDLDGFLLGRTDGLPAGASDGALQGKSDGLTTNAATKGDPNPMPVC